MRTDAKLDRLIPDRRRIKARFTSGHSNRPATGKLLARIFERRERWSVVRLIQTYGNATHLSQSHVVSLYAGSENAREWFSLHQADSEARQTYNIKLRGRAKCSWDIRILRTYHWIFYSTYAENNTKNKKLALRKLMSTEYYSSQPINNSKIACRSGA